MMRAMSMAGTSLAYARESGRRQVDIKAKGGEIAMIIEGPPYPATVFMEYPETGLDIRSIGQSAMSVIEEVRQGVQVVLATHNLEFLDALLVPLRDEEVASLALFRLRLNDGMLDSTRMAGEDVIFARVETFDDLR